ncbi:uncharacterized protein F4822DRAFT_434653 [Hypoxylon trugodes]|uniref:uncharacterized protein n=1 Tax=Hypoxylon trugodes TaxID=326681 RepID=UPI002194EEFE|nr:uncharacterized protein F4822DRAFT_434653 [Hypoxylon trugodes]KAI1383542.1 hypothetical protein F4822DRAFT_434653 [Hypoxylon trugodes]
MGGKLAIRIVPPGENGTFTTSARIFFRDIHENGGEEIRDPLSGVKAEPKDINRNDMIFWIEEQVLREFYKIHKKMKAEVERDEESKVEDRGEGTSTYPLADTGYCML